MLRERVIVIHATYVASKGIQYLLRLLVAAEEGEALGAGDLELPAGGGDGEGAVEAEERLAVVLGVVGRRELRLEAVQRARVVPLLQNTHCDSFHPGYHHDVLLKDFLKDLSFYMLRHCSVAP